MDKDNKKENVIQSDMDTTIMDTLQDSADIDSVKRAELAESVSDAVLDVEHNISESEAELLAEKKQAQVAELSPFRIVLKRFLKSKLSVVGIGLLIFLILFSFLGPVIYNKWGETEIDMSPGKVDTVESQYVYYDDDGNEHIVYIVIEDVRSPNYWADSSSNHIFGTDHVGRDVLTRLMYGGRVSLFIALVVIIVQTLIGVILGGLAGYFGKWVDQLIMRIVEIFLCVPAMPLYIIVGAIVTDSGVSEQTRIYILIAIMIFFGWANIARIVRGQILSLREQEYMIAAETMGFGNMRRIFKHLVPNIMPILLVTMTLGFGQIILAEAGLSFLGFGVPQPYASWGSMLSSIIYNGKISIGGYISQNVLLWLLPGLLILMAVLSFNFIGDGLRDAMDPKARR